ncbi:MAG: hypothetical protein ABFS32_22990 [Bacteroidota bacterium]
MKAVAKWVMIRLVRTAKQGSYGPIHISCFVSDNNEFYDFTVATLDFIKKTDARRFKRILKEIDWLVNTRRIKRNCGEYRHKMKLCSVNREIKEEYSKDDVVYFSTVLIHEATHGYLCSRKVEHTKERRASIERICVAEENRFLRKVAISYPKIAEQYYYEFNPDDWDYSFNTSKWKRAYDEMVRIIRS